MVPIRARSTRSPGRAGSSESLPCAAPASPRPVAAGASDPGRPPGSIARMSRGPGRPHPIRVFVMYAFALAREFRGTIGTIAVLMVLGTTAFALTPQAALNHRAPALPLAAFCSWMAFFGQVVFNPPETWVIEVLQGVYPIFGFVVLGEGVVRLALLMTSRRRGEREWMKVMASTLRGHVVVCGLGHLG